MFSTDHRATSGQEPTPFPVILFPVPMTVIETIFSPPSYVLINLENDVEGAEEFCGKHAIKHCLSTVVDDDQLPQDFGIKGIPHKVVIQNGKVVQNGTKEVKLDELRRRIFYSCFGGLSSVVSGGDEQLLCRRWRSINSWGLCIC